MIGKRDYQAQYTLFTPRETEANDLPPSTSQKSEPSFRPQALSSALTPWLPITQWASICRPLQHPTPVSVSSMSENICHELRGHTPNAGVTRESERECLLCKVEPQGCPCPQSLHAFLETKHFHGSFGPRAIFLLKKCVLGG